MAKRKSPNRDAAIDAARLKPATKPTHPKGTKSLSRDLIHLRKLKRTEALANRAKAAATAARKDFEEYCKARMAWDGADSQRTDNTTFYMVRTPYGVVQDRAVFLAWAQENAPDLIKSPEQRDGELNALIRRCLEDGEELPPGVGYTVKEYIGTRGA
jgi:hypothetical protein